jgi:hypothetical protein
MKRSLLSFLLAVTAIYASAQSQFSSIDINNVKAGFNPAGDLFWNYTNPAFEVPKGSGTGTIYAANFWIGGMDAAGQLHIAAQTYGQSGRDIFQGPMMASSAYSASQDAAWNTVWKINRSTIDSFRLWFQTPSIYPGYTIPSVIMNWPAHGNTTLGQAHDLAPFYDYDGDQTYDPASGDFPCIKGDQAVYFIYNDDRSAHTESGGAKLGVEVHGMAYAFDAPNDTALNNTIFLNYKIYNRSNSAYSNVYVGMWVDFDLGCYADDYVGSDVGRNAFYAYNGSPADCGSTGYGNFPPAQGVVFLKGPMADPMDGTDNDRDCIVDEANETIGMTDFVSYSNDLTPIGNPQTSDNYYNYMQSLWLDGTPVTHGSNGYNTGGPSSKYMYPGNTDHAYEYGTGGSCLFPGAAQPDWYETNTPGDRRGLGAAGPFTFYPGQEQCLDYAFVFARGASNTASVSLMQDHIDHVKALYNNNGLSDCGCSASPLAVNDHWEEKVVNIFPVPATENIYVDLTGMNEFTSYVIMDMTGRRVKKGALDPNSLNKIEFSHLSKGAYIISLSGEGIEINRKVFKQ